MLLECIDIKKNNAGNWLLLQTKIHKNEPFDNILKEFQPTEILMKNTVFHYKYSESKCIIFFLQADIAFVGEQLRMLINILKPLGISLIVVYDTKRKWGLTGLGNLDLVESISSLKSNIVYSNIATMGNSGPGLSALIYGLGMNIDGIYCINPLTNLSLMEMIGNKSIDEYYDETFKNQKTLSELSTTEDKEVLNKYSLLLFGKDDLPNLDTRNYLKNNKMTKIMIHYSKNYEPDRKSVDRIAYTDNVELIPVEHDNHFLANYFVQNNLIDKNLKIFFKKLGWI